MHVTAAVRGGGEIFSGLTQWLDINFTGVHFTLDVHGNCACLSPATGLKRRDNAETQSTMQPQRRMSGSETTLRLRAMPNSGRRGLRLLRAGCRYGTMPSAISVLLSGHPDSDAPASDVGKTGVIKRNGSCGRVSFHNPYAKTSLKRAVIIQKQVKLKKPVPAFSEKRQCGHFFATLSSVSCPAVRRPITNFAEIMGIIWLSELGMETGAGSLSTPALHI